MGRMIVGMILVALALVTQHSFAASAWTYEVEGVGAIVSDDQAGARQRAIRAALQEALEEAVLNVLDADVVVANIQDLNQRLYAQPWSYVSSYRVLWEYPDAPGKVYRVGVVVDIASPRLQQALAPLGGTTATAHTLPGAQETGTARLAILVTERHLGQATSTWWAERGVVTRALRSQLAERGVRIGELQPGLQWDGTEGGALKAAREAAIATLLVGHAGVQQIYNPNSGSAVHATLQLRILDAPTGGVLAQERGEGNVDDTQAGQASTLALEQAVHTVVPRLMPFLSAALRVGEPDSVTTP